MKNPIRQRGLALFLALFLALSMALSLLSAAAFAAEVEPPSGIVGDAETLTDSAYWGTESSNVAWATVNGGKKLYVFRVDPSKPVRFPSGSAMSANQGAPSNYRSITEVAICDGITTIGNFQFYQWTALETLSLPEGLNSIGSTTFNSCTKLHTLNLGKCTLLFYTQLVDSPIQTFTVDPANTAYKVENGALMSKDGKTFYRQAGDPTACIVPEGVEDISWYAFNTCSSLTTLHLPASLAKSDGNAGLDYKVFQRKDPLTNQKIYGVQNLHLPQDMTNLRLDLRTSDVTQSINVYYPGTAAEFQGYANGASYITSRASKDNFFFNGSTSPARKIFWRDTETATATRKTVLAAAGESVTLPADETGFTPPESGSFQGSFYFDGVLKPKGSTVTMPDHDVILYPNWFGNAVTVSLDVNGHGTLQNTQLTLEADGVTTYGGALPTLTADNYTFLGWFTDATTGTPVTADTPVAAGDHTLYAHWQENPKVTVTLDLGEGNGLGSVAPSTFQVPYPGKYPDLLPTPSWTDHIFDGWFTAAQGGVHVKAGDTMNISTDHSLYAHWTAVIDVAVTLDAAGGDVTPAQVTGRYPGGAYPTLPTPTRTGYEFNGWFNSPQLGDEIKAGDPINSGAAHTIYAHWTKIPEKYTLTLDPNGGSVAGQVTLPLTEGRPYPQLPVPTKPGYDFVGWYTEKSGGTQATSGTSLRVNADHTLYAHYTIAASHDSTAVLNYSFRFSNSAGAFQYPAGYRIPLERFFDVFGDNARARSLYEYMGKWNGSCGGMALSSALLYLPNPTAKPIRVQDFKQGPWQGTESTLYEKIMDMEIYGQHQKWRYSLRSFIEAMQIAQAGTNDGVFSDWSSYGPQAVYELVQQETTAQTPQPVFLVVRSPRVSHALLAYEAKVIDDTEARLYVYDCNIPANGDIYVTLRKSTSTGEYDSFSYDGYALSISARPFRSDAYPTWLANIDSKPPLDALMNLICVGAKSAQIVDANGKVVAIVNGDGTTQTAEGVEELTLAAQRADQTGESPIPEAHAFFVPRGKYTIENTANDGSELKVSVSNIDRSATVHTNAASMTVIVDDAQDLNYVKLNSPNTDYKIVLANSLTENGEDHYVEYLLSGSTGKESVTVARKGGETLTENVDLTQTGVSLSTRTDAQVYHDVDLDEIAAQCQNAADYEATFEQKATEAVAAAVAAQEAAPPLETGWSDTDADAAKLRPITDKDLGSYGSSSSDNKKPHTPWWPGIYGPSTDSARPADSTVAVAPGDQTAPETPPAAVNPFLDVSANAYYYDAVIWAVDKGIIKGLSETAFAPEALCTRAQLATMLYRANGESVVTGEFPFQDVSVGAYYHDAVNWAYQTGIVKGMTQTAFSPDLPCTRAQAVVMLYRASGESAAAGELPFRDVGAGAYYHDAVSWAYQKGIIKGVTEETFSPDALCTRAMIAAMLYRANAGADSSASDAKDT